MLPLPVTPGCDGEEVFACRGLHVRFGEPAAHALRGIDLRQTRGEMVGILGSTGAGKSTLLKCANRIVPELQHASTEGEVRLFGRLVDGVRVADLAGRVGFVFQDFEAQLFSTSVREEILFGLEQIGVPTAEMDERVRWALDAVGLTGFESRDPTSLSGGEKQRLAIAAALALRPGLLLLDEPSTDLDPAGQREIFDVLSRLRGSGASLLVAEHDVEALRDADRLVVLHEGEVVTAGPPSRVLEDPRRLETEGVRPPELARLCAALGLSVWPIDVDAVETRLRGAGVRLRNGRAAPPPGDRPVLLEAERLRFRYPDAERDAVRDVSLVLREGERVALVGSNGSGKSTLARHLNGMLAPGAGRVLWRGRPISGLGASERASAVGYVFQNPDEQIFAASVEEEVAFGPVQVGLDGAEIERRVREALAAVGLERLRGRDPFLLGKSERQRVAVASVLTLSPSVLLLDEPTTGLDYRQTLELFAVFERLHRSGKTIVLITHVPWLVAAYAERVVLMNQGEILWDGDVRALFEREDLCLRGDFLPPAVTRLGRRFGVTPLTVEECLAWVESG